MSGLETLPTRESTAEINSRPPQASRYWLFQAHPEEDTRIGLAVQYPWQVWVAILSAFVAVHYTLFGFVHNMVDLRVCVGYAPDPILELIPFDTHWSIITREGYTALTLGTAAVVIWQAIRGVHTPALRLALALCFMTSMRMTTLTMIPLCRPTVAAFGPPPLSSPQMLNLHFFSVPWRIFALNDLVYSGHTALFVLVLLMSGTWYVIARWGVGIFLLFMIYGLLATRDHYSVDILLAFPCAFFADFLAVKILRRVNPGR